MSLEVVYFLLVSRIYLPVSKVGLCLKYTVIAFVAVDEESIRIQNVKECLSSRSTTSCTTTGKLIQCFGYSSIYNLSHLTSETHVCSMDAFHVSNDITCS